jgi:hypothetical protein
MRRRVPRIGAYLFISYLFRHHSANLITFSAQADKFVRRRKGDAFCDLSLLPTRTIEQIVCFASKEYIPLFTALTSKVRGERIIFYNSATPPSAPNCKLVRFGTRTRTNWQYECAAAFLRGKLMSALAIPESGDAPANVSPMK